MRAYNLVFLTVACLLAYAVTTSAHAKDPGIKKLPSWVTNNLKNTIQPLTSQPFENRVMFDEDIYWALSRSNTDEILNLLSISGFNVYIPCVWHGKGTHFPSKVAHQDPRVSKRIKRGDDPLQYLIDEAKLRNIEVHPWFTVVRRDDDQKPEFFPEGTPDNAYNVQDPEFRHYIVSIIQELISNYDIQGINLDYIRSMGYCQTAKCAEDYNKQFGANLTTDLILEKIPKSRIKNIERWNESAIEEIVRNVSLSLRMKSRDLVLSVDSVPNARHLRMQGQDSQKWLNNDWIDIIYYMQYKRDFLTEHIDLAKSKVSRPDNIIPLLAVYDLDTLARKSGFLIDHYIQASRKLWPKSGLAFYHRKQLNLSAAEYLGTRSYRSRALPTWQANEVKK